MDIKFCKLNQDMASDYIDFFDERAFSDGNINKGCYCVWHHWTEKQEYERSLMPKEERPFCKRNYAIELIKNNKLNGFAAYCDDKIVGFCNADAKENYFRLSRENNPASWQGTNDKDKILAIVCFVVAPDMRGKGIAKGLLRCACKYAEENGFDSIEAYPTVGEFEETNCCGSLSMYQRSGFEIINIPDGVVARRSCCTQKP